MEISVIIPSYNEEKNIMDTLNDVAGYLSKKFPDSWEIVVVDDGSVDSTYKLAKDFMGAQSRYKDRIRLLQNEKNSGKGAAVRKGMLAAKGKMLLFMDADSATKITEFDKMLPAFSSGYDFMVGSRHLEGAFIKEKQPLLRRLFGKVHHYIVGAVLGISASDYNCGFKSFSARVAKTLFSKQRIDGWVFDAEVLFLARKNNIKIKEIPVEWEHKSTSKVRILRDTIKSLMGIIEIRLNDMKGYYK